MSLYILSVVIHMLDFGHLFLTFQTYLLHVSPQSTWKLITKLLDKVRRKVKSSRKSQSLKLTTAILLAMGLHYVY